ncbi:MAG TPA: AAA family ATPase, partial [Polyangia bacterium]
MEDGPVGRARPLALKLFRVVSPAVERRVRAEFERLAGLEHRSVVRVRDVGRSESGRLYLVTELVTGPSLLSIADLGDEAERRARWQQAALGLADALAYMHGRAAVHGDVSPDNIRLADDGTPVLLDVGGWILAAPGAACGTLGYAAPEALVGRVTPASDLFGLGASLFAAWTGGGPFGVGAQSVGRLLAGAPAPLLSSVRPGASAGWDALVSELLRPAPDERPSSAREVVRRMRRHLEPSSASSAPAGGEEPSAELLPPHPGGDVLAGVFVGRERERALLAGALRDLADGASRWSVVALHGPEGSGRRRLIEQALQELALDQLARPERQPVGVFRGSVAALLEAWSGPPDKKDAAGDAGSHDTPTTSVASNGRAEPSDADPERARHRRLARLVRDLEESAAQRPLCVVLEPDDVDAGQAAFAVASFVAGASPSGRLLVLLPARQPLARVGALDVEVTPLAREEIARLVERAAGERLPDVAVIRLLEASGGHAGIACHLTRQLVEAVRRGTAGRFEPERDVDLGRRLAEAFGRLSRGTRGALARLALGMAPAEATSPDGGPVFDPLDDARSAGWLHAGDPPSAPPRLSSPAHAAVILDALGDADLRPTAELAAARLSEADGRRGLALLALGRAAEAARTFRLAAAVPEGGRNLHEAGDAADRLSGGRSTRDPAADREEAAARWLWRLYRLDPAALTTDERIRLADRLSVEGRPAEAEATLT